MEVIRSRPLKANKFTLQIACFDQLLPEVVYIPAVKDASDEVKTKEASSFGKIISNAERVELDLKRRLAEAFQTYASALAQAETYAMSILPKAQETFELVQRGYRLGEIGYLDLLTAQRTYSQTNLAYLDALSALWASWTEIDGLLLSGSLSMPPN